MALNKVTKCRTMLVQDSFLGSLLVLPVELWNGIVGQNNNQIHRNKGSYSYPNWLFGCSAWVTEPNSTQQVGYVEKPHFSIGLISSCADQFNSCALLKSKIACLHVSFTTYEYFYKLSKSASFSRWLLHPVTQKNQ